MTTLEKIREEIERRMKVHMVSNHGFSARYDELKDLLSFLDTMQEEEVDLEKEIKETCRSYRITDSYESSLGKNDIRNIATHFYNLGKQSSDKDCKE